MKAGKRGDCEPPLLQQRGESFLQRFLLLIAENQVDSIIRSEGAADLFRRAAGQNQNGIRILRTEMTKSLPALPCGGSRYRAGVYKNDIASFRGIAHRQSHAPEAAREQSRIGLIQPAAERQYRRGCHARIPFRNTTLYSAGHGSLCFRISSLRTETGVPVFPPEVPFRCMERSSA